MSNLKRRVGELERRSGVGKSPIVFQVVREGENLSPEEEKSLNDYQEKMVTAAEPGQFVIVTWTKQKAQLLARRKTSCGV